MSTLAWRADSQELACDSMGVEGWTIAGFVVKGGCITTRAGSVLYGSTGDGMAARRFRDWVRAGCIGEPHLCTGTADQATASGLIFPGGDLVLAFDWTGARSYRAPFTAYGSGGKIALGALAAGASAREAIEAAAAWDIATNGPVQVHRRSATAPKFLTQPAP